MPKFVNSKVLPFSDKQLYNIIINVESYPEFLPWCKGSEISNRIDENNFDAKLTIGYKALDESYTSRVQGIYLKKITTKRSLKKSLMGDLLTGRVRVSVD